MPHTSSCRPRRSGWARERHRCVPEPKALSPPVPPEGTWYGPDACTARSPWSGKSPCRASRSFTVLEGARRGAAFPGGDVRLTTWCRRTSPCRRRTRASHSPGSPLHMEMLVGLGCTAREGCSFVARRRLFVLHVHRLAAPDLALLGAHCGRPDRRRGSQQRSLCCARVFNVCLAFVQI
jgi:hypothetical protein